nr:MAG TPA: hypothetical protein [Caudoviricetes sp.]
MRCAICFPLSGFSPLTPFLDRLRIGVHLCEKAESGI